MPPEDTGSLSLTAPIAGIPEVSSAEEEVEMGADVEVPGVPDEGTPDVLSAKQDVSPLSTTQNGSEK